MTSEGSSSRVVIHIGTHKTGTTAIQDFCARNCERFRERGLEYPLGLTNVRLGHQGQHCVAWQLLGSDEKRHLFPDAVPDPGKWLRDAVARGKHNVLLSSENFCRLGLSQVEQLQALFEGQAVDVIVYLRRQDHYLQALYQTARLHSGYAGGIWDLAEEVQLNYFELLRPWVDTFGPDRVHVRVYDTAGQGQRRIEEDFLSVLQQIGFVQDLKFKDLQLVGYELNQSFPRACVEAICQIVSMDADPRIKDRLIQIAFHCYKGTRHAYGYLSSSDCRMLMDRFQESNARVASELLGVDQLFRNPVSDVEPPADAPDLLLFFDRVLDVVRRAG